MTAVSFLAQREFRPSLVPTLAAIALVVLTVLLGNWQRHRAAEKDALRERYEQAATLPPLVLPGAAIDPDAVRYRAVRASGTYDSAHQVLIDNRVHKGRAGFDVVTPLVLGASGRAVLVDRGWVPAAARRSELPEVPVPHGVVTINGRANLPPRFLDLGQAHPSGVLWPNLDIAKLAQASGLELLPIVVEEDASDARDGLVREWPQPDLGSERHLSYMMQWYSLAALAVVLWLTLNWRPRT